MQIFLTFDYELFFGSKAGSIEKCMIEPTQRLLEIAERNAIKLVFFVDIGYYIHLKKQNSQKAVNDTRLFEKQIRQMIDGGHDVQLHIHPHWEKAIYESDSWIFDMKNAYKLADFPDSEIERIVRDYKTALDDLTQKKSFAFRAGGWCIQPFHRLEQLFMKLGIRIDSSVFPGAKYSTDQYDYDFTNAPKKDSYCFQSDVTIETENGFFTEIPITSYRYSPLFYWKLYILGRLFPNRHKMVGDGVFLSQPGKKKSVLTNYTWNHASSDGYYASKLNDIAKRNQGNSNMVVIGHPKGMTEYSFKQLERFIQHQKKKKHTFVTFSTYNSQ